MKPSSYGSMNGDMLAMCCLQHFFSIYLPWSFPFSYLTRSSHQSNWQHLCMHRYTSQSNG